MSRQPPADDLSQAHESAAEERIRREPAARTGPIRDASLIFRSPPDPRTRHAAHDSTMRSEGPSLESGVSTAYRVYDDYMRRGRDAARSFGGPGTDAQPPSYSDLARRAMRYWSDAVGMMLDSLGTMNGAPRRAHEGDPRGADFQRSYGPEVPNRPPAEPSWYRPNYGRNEPPAASDANRPGTALYFEVNLGRAVEVRLHLGPEAAGRSLSAPELAALDVDGAAPLTGVRLARDGALGVTLQIAPEQPAGTYSGPVFDEARGVPLGSLTVTLKN